MYIRRWETINRWPVWICSVRIDLALVELVVEQEMSLPVGVEDPALVSI